MNLSDLVEAFGEDENHAEWERIVDCCLSVLLMGPAGLQSTQLPIQVKKPIPEQVDFEVLAPKGLPEGWYSVSASVADAILQQIMNEAHLIPTLALCIPTNVHTKPEWGVQSVLCVMLCCRDDELFAFSGIAMPAQCELPDFLKALTDKAIMEVRFGMSPYAGRALDPLRDIINGIPPRRGATNDPSMN